MLVRAVLSKALGFQPRLRNANQYCPLHGILISANNGDSDKKVDDEEEDAHYLNFDFAHDENSNSEDSSSGLIESPGQSFFTPPLVNCSCPKYQMKSFDEQDISFYIRKTLSHVSPLMNVGYKTLKDAVYIFFTMSKSLHQSHAPNHQ
jgi:hypothetical protein